MKKIINNKLYDTETAKELGSWDNMADVRNFNYFTETLYRKRTGEFFLHGDGGPATKYAVSIGQNQWSGGQKIIPLTVEAARDWAEQHLDADEYAQIFGMPDESAEKVTLIAQVDSTLGQKVRELAAERGISVKALITEALERYIG